MGKPTVGVEEFLHKRLLFREFEGKTGITVKGYCTACGRRLSRGEGGGLVSLRRHTFCQQRQKVCKKRRLNLRFKDPLARPVPFRPLGCVPHGWECFARGFKCRIIPAMALILQNIRCMFLMFSCRRGHRPLRKKYAPPTFHTFSGSGAGGETIQSLGHVLQISLLSTKKRGPQKNLCVGGVGEV